MLRSYPAMSANHEGQGGQKKVAKYELEGRQLALLVFIWACLCVDSPCLSLCMQSRGGNGPCGASQGDGAHRWCPK